MIRALPAVLAVVTPLLFAAPAGAAAVTRTFDFVLEDFEGFGVSIPTPYETMTGSFTLTYDPEVEVLNATTGLVVNGVSAPFDGYLAFSYRPNHGPGQNLFQFGAITGPGDKVDTFLGGFDEVYFTFTEGLPDVAGAYTVQGDDGIWISMAGTVEVTTATVPEPAAWALIILGFGVCGAALRRRATAEPA